MGRVFHRLASHCNIRISEMVTQSIFVHPFGELRKHFMFAHEVELPFVRESRSSVFPQFAGFIFARCAQFRFCRLNLTS